MGSQGRPELEFSFSYTADSYLTPLSLELLDLPTEDVPIEIFSHASTMQALVRYLADTRAMTIARIADLLGRTPSSVRSSYTQTRPLPKIDSASLRVPLSIFRSGLAPLEALVHHLRTQGLRNVEIARILDLDPRTTHTAWRRAEAKR